MSTVLLPDPQFVSFLPRRTEDSATVIWVYLYAQCDFVFQRESNASNSATIGLFVPNEKNSVKKVLLFSFHDINTKLKIHRCVIQLKDHHIVESGKPNSKQSKKFTRKSAGFNFAAFLGFLGLIPVT